MTLTSLLKTSASTFVRGAAGVAGGPLNDLIVVGGGVSKKAHKWVPLLSTRTRVVPWRRKSRASATLCETSISRPAW